MPYVTLLLLLASICQARAQADAVSTPRADWRIGFGLGMILGNDAELPDDLRTQARLHVRRRIGELLQLEIGGGIGRVAGMRSSFDSYLAPVDGRLLLAPALSDLFTPYVYIGYGATWYRNTLAPTGSVETKGWVPHLPLGGGFQLNVDETFALDMALGANLLMSDRIDGNPDGANDSYISVLLGFELLLSGEAGEESNDRDGDGLSDDEELKYRTNPGLADTDNDRLNDAQEIRMYRTDPIVADSDGDGIRDGEEVLSLHTDPLMRDTDGDGVIDIDDDCPRVPGLAKRRGCK